MVNRENYEEYMMLYVDGELDEAGEQALHAFVAAHPDLQAELAAYESCRLQPEEQLVFGDKDALLKQPVAVASRRSVPKSWWAYGAAAGLVLLLALLLKQPVKEPVLAVKKPTPAVRGLQAPVPAATMPSAPMAPSAQAASAAAPTPAPAPVVETGAPPAPGPASAIAALPVQEPVLLPAEPETVAVASEVAVPVLPAPTPSSRERGPHLPIAMAENMEALGLLKEAVTTSAPVQTVRQLRQGLRGTDVAVHIGNRELFTLRF